MQGDAPAQNPLFERIMRAAFDAFMENGYAGTTTLEIATRAKISKRDLYASFPSKEAVLVACIASRAERMRLAADLPKPRSRSMLAAALTSFGANLVREVCQPAVTAMFRLAIAEAQRSPQVAKILNGSRLSNRAALADLLAEGQSRGILSKGDPHQMTEHFFALLWGDLLLARLLDVAAPPKPAEVDSRARAATDAFLQIYGLPQVSD
jgi:AcrR family transcriptional regulator